MRRLSLPLALVLAAPLFAQKAGPPKKAADPLPGESMIREYFQRQPVVRAGEQVPDLLFTAAEVVTALGGIAAQRITLGRGRLELEIQVQAGDHAMPVAVGWHPWFRRPARGDMAI